MTGLTAGLAMFAGMILLMAVRVPIAIAMFIPGAIGYVALASDAAWLSHM